MFFLKLKSVKIHEKDFIKPCLDSQAQGFDSFLQYVFMTVLQNLGIQAFHGLKFFAKNRKKQIKA